MAKGGRLSRVYGKMDFSIVWVMAFWLAGCGVEQGDEVLDSGSYIVVVKQEGFLKSQSLEDRIHAQAMVKSTMAGLVRSHSLGNPEKVFHSVLPGGVYHLTAEQAKAMHSDPRVAYIEKDQMIQIESVQSDSPWGLDRLDQGDLPLDRNYQLGGGASDSGAGVNVYVIDTGVLVSHQEFAGRAVHGTDLVDRDGDSTDCNGHGTHVAGSIAAQTYGVAKRAKIIGVRVLDCAGSGRLSDVIAGIDWVTENHVKPAVANMSLGGGASQAIDDAVRNSIAAGVTHVVAAGNENTNACTRSPARVEQAITVGASTRSDIRSSFSNYGTCVDVFAPGSDIQSAWYTSATATNTISGTSMASPHVAGVAALYLARHPGSSPAEVREAILGGAISGRLSSIGSGSPNLLLNIGFLSGTDGGQAPPPQPTPPEDRPCDDCDEFQGELSRRGSIVYLPDATGYQSDSGLQEIWLKGPKATDFDVYLYKRSGVSWAQVASGVGLTSEEMIRYSGSAGTYRLKVVAYSGSGDYRLFHRSTKTRVSGRP